MQKGVSLIKCNSFPWIVKLRVSVRDFRDWIGVEGISCMRALNKRMIGGPTAKMPIIFETGEILRLLYVKKLSGSKIVSGPEEKTKLACRGISSRHGVAINAEVKSKSDILSLNSRQFKSKEMSGKLLRRS